MFKGKPKLVITTADERDPTRVELAAAIAAASLASNDFENAKDAAARAAVQAEAIEAELDEARSAIGEARAAAADMMARAAERGERITPDKTLREARILLAEIEDVLDAARDAKATLEAALGGYDQALRQARKRVETAVRPVLAAEGDRLMAEIEHLQGEAAGKRAALAFILSEGHPWPPTDESKRIESFLTRAVYPGAVKDHPAYSAWSQAFAALKADPDAPLPAT